MNLIRDTKTTAETLSNLLAGPLACDAIEQPDNHDQPGHSCVPIGTYQLVQHTSARLHEDDGVTPLRTWALVNPSLGVTHSPDDPIPGNCQYPHRSECLIHPANFARQLEGCIAPGAARTRAQGSGEWMVTNSRESFKMLRAYLDAHPEDWTLTISEEVQT